MPTSTPLLTSTEHARLTRARGAGRERAECSLDLGRSVQNVDVHPTHWSLEGAAYPYLDVCKDRTIYYWDGQAFRAAARFTASLIKLIPTEWGAPTFEIDGIKMLPTSQRSPYEDAREKVDLIEPRGKVILDTCAGLGYFAAWCLERGAAQVRSFEKNPDVLWLRRLNPWSPAASAALHLELGDSAVEIAALAPHSVDAVLHDPPRFGIAGELYSQTFYDHLARVLQPRGRLFHYTGSPNKLTSGRDVPREVLKRLIRAGFAGEIVGDGILATNGATRARP